MTAPAALAGARVALLAPIGRPTPPVGYGPWEQVAYDIAEGLVARGLDVTLFATGNSRTRAHLDYVVPVGIDEDPALDGDVYGALHIAKLFARAGDFLIGHAVRADAIRSFYCSISDADRDPGLDYLATAYNGIDPSAFTFVDRPGDYLVFLGRFHPEKGTHLAIEIGQGQPPAGPDQKPGPEEHLEV